MLICFSIKLSRSKLLSNRNQFSAGAYAGGVHWAHVHPPTRKKNFAQKCPKEETECLPDMLSKKNVHVPLRYDKIETKKVGKKKI